MDSTSSSSSSFTFKTEGERGKKEIERGGRAGGKVAPLKEEEEGARLEWGREA